MVSTAAPWGGLLGHPEEAGASPGRTGSRGMLGCGSAALRYLLLMLPILPPKICKSRNSRKRELRYTLASSWGTVVEA